MVSSIAAVVPNNVLVGFVNSTVDSKTFLTIVLDASSAASIVLDWLRFLTSVSSDNSLTIDSESPSTLVGKNPVSVVSRSNGVSSLVEDPVSSKNMSIEISDSDSSGSVTVVSFVGVEHSSARHLGSDHELATSDWESTILGLMILNFDKFDLRDSPGLIVSGHAVPESDWLIVSISSTNDIKALSFIVSDVLEAARVEVESLLLFSSPSSDDSSSSDSESLTGLVGYN